MYRQILSITLVVFLVIVLESCKKSEPTAPTIPDTYVSFLHYGAVVPSPISTLVTIDRANINYSSSQDGNQISFWSAKIQGREYDRLISIIDNNRLVGIPNPSGDRPCVGSRGMSIFIKTKVILDTINISGIYMCDKSCWPTGLDSLIAYRDSLVNKYKQ